MEIVKVTTSHIYHYIPLQGWDSVVNAVKIYAGGEIRGSRESEKHQLRDVAKASESYYKLSFYVTMAEHLHGDVGLFVEKMLNEAEVQLQESDGWRGSYEYDGVGPFFKTDIRINVLDREQKIFALGIRAVPAGDDPERELAEYLGIPRALMLSEVTVQTEPDGWRFAFDFEQLVRQLDGIIDIHKVKGVEIANAMMQVDLWGDTQFFTLYVNGTVKVYISSGRIGRRFVRVDPDPEKLCDTWATSGAVWKGPLAKSLDDPSTIEPPAVIIRLVSPQGDDCLLKPIWVEGQKQAVLDLTQQIAHVLQVS